MRGRGEEAAMGRRGVRRGLREGAFPGERGRNRRFVRCVTGSELHQSVSVCITEGYHRAFGCSAYGRVTACSRAFRTSYKASQASPQKLKKKPCNRYAIGAARMPCALRLQTHSG